MTATPLPEPVLHQVQPSAKHYSWEPADDYLLAELSAIPTERHRYLFTADQMTAHELAGYKRGLEAAALRVETAHTWLTNVAAANLIRARGEQK